MTFGNAIVRGRCLPKCTIRGTSQAPSSANGKSGFARIMARTSMPTHAKMCQAFTASGQIQRAELLNFPALIDKRTENALKSRDLDPAMLQRH